MSEQEDRISEARDSLRRYVDTAKAAPVGLKDALRIVLDTLAQAQPEPSLVVRGEEELADAIFEARYPEGVWMGGSSEPPERSDAEAARTLIANGTVQVVPSLVAATREAVIDGIQDGLDEFESHYPAARTKSLREYVADALLAPGGPVQVADATPEQPWDVAISEWSKAGVVAALREVYDAGYRQGVADEITSNDNIGIAGLGGKIKPERRNPYDGFTRKETGQ